MSDVIETLVEREYAFGFHSDVATERAPKGLNEDVVRLISAKKEEPEWLLEWRLAALRHFLTLEEPEWQNVHHPPTDYHAMHNWAAPQPKGPGTARPDEAAPQLRATSTTLGTSLARPATHAAGAATATM